MNDDNGCSEECGVRKEMPEGLLPNSSTVEAALSEYGGQGRDRALALATVVAASLAADFGMTHRAFSRIATRAWKYEQALRRIRAAKIEDRMCVGMQGVDGERG